MLCTVSKKNIHACTKVWTLLFLFFEKSVMLIKPAFISSNIQEKKQSWEIFKMVFYFNIL